VSGYLATYIYGDMLSDILSVVTSSLTVILTLWLRVSGYMATDNDGDM